MKLFGQLIRTAVNVATLPVAVVRDVVTGGGVFTGHNDHGRIEDTHTARAVDRLKREASEDDE